MAVSASLTELLKEQLAPPRPSRACGACSAAPASTATA